MGRVSRLIVNSFSTGISNTLARATARSNDGQCIPFAIRPSCLSVRIRARRAVSSCVRFLARIALNARIVSRSMGASAVAGTAYRSGERLTDERTGGQHDYRQRDGLDGAEILTPRDSPE